MIALPFSMRLCVPEDWTDSQIADFAESRNPCGAFNGWYVAQAGDEALRNPSTKKMTEPRIACADQQGMVHVVVTC